jgi:subtilisin family serine protease
MCLRIGWHASDGGGYVSMDYAAQALNYAAAINNNPNQTAKVVAANCSWGSSSLSALQTALQNAIAAGILICKAAGNSNNQTADFLNAKGGDTTMSVAATDSLDKKASFSSYGTWVDVSAPGVDIISTYHYYPDPAGEYVAKSSGTSMSAPHVAGLAGLIKSWNPGWTRSQVSAQIKGTTDNIDALQQKRFRGKMGTGRINACRALGGSAAASVEVEPVIEEAFVSKASLSNAPNPFNASTSISYYVPRDAQVTLEVYNIRGQKVKTLVNGTKSAGSYLVIWDGTNSNGDVVSSGVYFYNLSIGVERVTKKMTFLK